MKALRQSIAGYETLRRHRNDLLRQAKQFKYIAPILRKRAKEIFRRMKELDAEADRIAAYEVSR